MKTIVFSFLILICSVAIFPHTVFAQNAPPIVHIIYFIPKDRTPQPDIDEKLDTLIKDVQTFYADHMEAHGHGRKTFRFETDARGKAVVHHVNGKFTDRHYYNDTFNKVKAELNDTFGLAETIHFISIDIGNELIDTHSCGVGGIEGTVLGGYSLIPASGACFVGDSGVDVAAHELGHAFGLQHDFRNDAYLMSYGVERSRLSDCAAHWLNRHPAFNPGGVSLNQDTTIKRLSSGHASLPNAIPFRFEITDPDGIHQVQLLTPTVDTTHTVALGSLELVDYRQLNRSQSGTVEFVVTRLTAANESVSLQIIDWMGNITMSKSYSMYISILEMPPEVVSIPDPHLAAAVQAEIGESITTHTMLSLRKLSVRGREITDLTGLEHAHNLESLYAIGNPISDVSPLAGLTQLTELNIRATEVSDITPLTDLTQLTLLSLGYRVSDITPLAGLTQLKRLYLIGVSVSDLLPLADLTQLEWLDLREAKVSDLSPLAGLTQLEYLWLMETDVSDLSPLAGLTQLEYLWLWLTPILDISALAGLTQLTYLGLDSTEVSDISALAGLTQLTELGLSRTLVSDVSPLAGLTQMKDLSFYNTAVSDVSPLAGLTQLTELHASNAAISDVSALAGLTQLKTLNLGYNTILDISALAGLTQLTWLGLGGNVISDVSALAGLTQLTYLDLYQNRISDVSALAGLIQLTDLDLGDNTISDVSPLAGLTQLTYLSLSLNPLSYASLHTHISAMQAKGTEVRFFARTPTTLEIIAGTAQSGLPNTTLPFPLVVEVRDHQNSVFSEVPVTFAITTGDGKLSVTTTKTDADGRAQTYLTLGATAGTTTVRVSAAEISRPIQFTATVVNLGAQIDMPDTALRTRIAATLGKPNNETITVADMLQLTELTANNANVRLLTGLQQAANLTTLSLDNNAITDVTALTGLTQLQTLSLDNNHITNIAALTGLTQLRTLSLHSNRLADVTPLIGFPQLKTLDVRGNLLSYPTLYTDIPTIQAGGTTVTFDQRTPTTLVKISDTQGAAEARLPIIIEVQDEQGFGFSGVPVTFSITAGVGRLSVTNVVTNGIGRAETFFTLGAIPGERTLQVVTTEPLQPISFRITAVDPNIPVSIPDANLKHWMVETLHFHGWFGGLFGEGELPLDPQLTVRHMWAFGAITVSNIQDLTGLEHAGDLNELTVSNSTVSDLSPIAGLAQLRELHLYNNSVSDISSLAGLTQLTELGLSNNSISDLSPIAGLAQLRELHLYNNSVSDISSLAGLTHLTGLDLSNNSISDLSPIAGLAQLRELHLYNNSVSDISSLAGLTHLTGLDLSNNSISDLSVLVGLTQATYLSVEGNPLNYVSLHTHIPAMQAKGINVYFDERVYPALDIISGAGQQAAGGESLAKPLVVAAIDANGMPMPGVRVTFTVGNGDLSPITAMTDANGRAETTFTLGSDPGRYSVHASATAVNSVTFIAIATAPAARRTADVNGDGVVNIQDLVVVASQIGQAGQNEADVNDDGAVNIQDLVLVAGALGADAAAPSAWQRTEVGVPPREKVQQWLTQAHRLRLTDHRSQRGVFLLEQLLAALAPKETALLANYPNPFNPETWIPYQLAKPVEVMLTIYDIKGCMVRSLNLGHQHAGMYQGRSRAAYWDGRNTAGEPAASGVYFYTLTAGDFSATRKMLILK